MTRRGPRLRDVAADLETFWSNAQQEAKSNGNAPLTSSDAVDIVAEIHAIVRAMEGFTLDQMLSEYRALRASVPRLSGRRRGIDESSEAEQVTRFNEAIDEQTEGFEIVGKLSRAPDLVATLGKLEPDILVLDLEMPGLSPLEARRELTSSGTQTRTVVKGSDALMGKRQVSSDEAKRIGTTLGVNWDQVDLEQFRRGVEVEFEHGSHDPETNVTNDDLELTGKIAWAHLKEFPDYYTRLAKLESEADAYWSSRR